MTKATSITLTFIFIVFNITNSFGYPNTSSSSYIEKINSVNRIDISKNIIYGEKADFYINIPVSWNNYIVAEREVINYKTRLLEKINFYYEPQNNISKPLFLMSIYIHNKSEWDSTLSYVKVLESKKYIFSMFNASKNPFTNKTDKALFNRFLSESNSVDFIKSLIVVNDNNKPQVSNTITVNNKLLKTTIVYKDNNVVYLPIRDTCKALGYDVTWNDKQKSISISNEDFISELFIDNTKNNYFRVVLINNSSFVSFMYLIKDLKCTVEVDENSNVFISK